MVVLAVQPTKVITVVVVAEKNTIMDVDVILLLTVEDADIVLQSAVNVVQSAVPDVVEEDVVEHDDGCDIKLSLQVLFFAYLSDK
jgi:hypothetical protein